MITVLPVKDEKKKENLFLKFGIPFDFSAGVVVAEENGKECGYCFYNIKNTDITIEDIFPKENLALADGVLRSALHVAVCNNVTEAFYGSKAPVELLKRLGFISDEKQKKLNINKLFESCCSCNNKNA